MNEDQHDELGDAVLEVVEGANDEQPWCIPIGAAGIEAADEQLVEAEGGDDEDGSEKVRVEILTTSPTSSLRSFDASSAAV